MVSTWFEKQFGFPEFDVGSRFGATNSDRIRSHFLWDHDAKKLTATAAAAAGRTFHVGEFTTPSLRELKEIFRELSGGETDVGVGEAKVKENGLTIQNISGDVGKLITDPSNEGAIFQAASQFNCLEMINPAITPEAGITDYVKDRTQGPIVAMKAPAGTLFRNYFVTSDNHPGLVKGTKGQTAKNQIDTSGELHEILKDASGFDIWSQNNGYMTPNTPASISDIGSLLKQKDNDFLESCKDALRTGVHWDTETNAGHCVAQVYCSACPVAYDRITDIYASKDPVTNKIYSKHELWAPLASMVLESTYESTLLVAAIVAYREGKRKTLFLTKVGGGVFGNADSWIAKSIEKACKKYRDVPVDVKVVHYGSTSGPSNRYSSISPLQS